MVLSLLARQRSRIPLDAADALALAICHLHAAPAPSASTETCPADPIVPRVLASRKYVVPGFHPGAPRPRHHPAGFGLGKTGMFMLVRGAERGYIYLRNGRIVHAELGALPGEEAVYALAIWSTGDFQFTPGKETETVTIDKTNTSPPHGSRPPPGRMEGAGPQDSGRGLRARAQDARDGRARHPVAAGMEPRDPHRRPKTSKSSRARRARTPSTPPRSSTAS